MSEEDAEKDAKLSKATGVWKETDLHKHALNNGFLGSKAKKIHNRAEACDTKTEFTFNWLQVITAVFGSFAHGANDVANAIGPLTATLAVYEYNGLQLDSEDNVVAPEVPLWVLAMGVVCIWIGVSTYGYRIIETIGIRLGHITPLRGFVITLSTALTVIVSSILGLPVSTTQVMVAATMGVGLVDGKGGGVNWWLVLKIFSGWVGTLIVAGSTAAAAAGLLFWTPSMVYLDPHALNMTVQSAS